MIINNNDERYEVVYIPVSNVIKIKNGLTWESISNKYDFSKYKFNRINYGSKNGNSSIDEKTARKICLLLKDGKTPTEISKDINISRKIVYDIKHRLTWCNIYEEVIC